jgi:hypothetical protein
VPLPLSEYAIDFAASSVCRNDSTLPISGAFPHHHADQRAGEFCSAVRTHQTLPAEFLGGVSIQDHEVGSFPSREASGNGFRRIAHGWAACRDQMMTARAFEGRTEFGIGAVKTRRDHHLHVGGECRPRHQQHGQPDHGQPENNRLFHRTPPARIGNHRAWHNEEPDQHEMCMDALASAIDIEKASQMW